MGRIHKSSKKSAVFLDISKFLIWLCGGIIVPLILVPLLFQLYISPSQKNKENRQENIFQLNEYIRTLFFRDEETYRLCAEKKDGKVLNEKIDEINQKRDATLEKLVNNTINLYQKGYITEADYREIKKFSEWNNMLYFAHKKICLSSLKNPDELTKWRESITRTLV